MTTTTPAQRTQQRDQMLALLASQFPLTWFRPGEEFAEEYGWAIWTGEGSSVGDQPAFNYYGYTNTMGVHPDLLRVLNQQYLYAEFRDPGTVFIWPR